MNLLVAPVFIPLLAAAVGVMLPKTRAWQGGLAVLANAVLLGVCFCLFFRVRGGDILSLNLGGWAAPFGVVFVADMLAAVMLCVSSVIALATAVYACADIDNERIRYGFFAFLNFLICGICGAFLTGDLFNLYVWFEVMLIASFALLSLGGLKRQLFGTIKYVALNLIATLLLLTAIGILYGLTGSVNMADVAQKIILVENKNLVTATAMIFLLSFGIKTAVFPLFFWLPASYHMPPVAVSAIFAGLLTKVGVYAMYRVMTLIFVHDISWTHGILAYVAGFTMIAGVLGAAVQTNIRRIFSFHIISQIGYMVMGLALMTKMAIVGGVFYIVHHIIVKANLFFVGGLIRILAGSSDVERMGGLYWAAPGLAVLFMIPALSLAGIPPLSGFWAKFSIVLAGMEVQAWGLVFVALFTGLLTIYSMIKIWREAFWKKHPDNKSASVQVSRRSLFADVNRAYRGDMARFAGPLLVTPCLFLAGLTVWIGLNPQPLFEAAELVATQLLAPELYIQAVLGGINVR